jgi:hypothetical protein
MEVSAGSAGYLLSGSAGRLLWPEPIGRKAMHGVRAETPVPWRRSTSTTTFFRPLAIATPEVAGPSPCSLPNRRPLSELMSIRISSIRSPTNLHVCTKKTVGCDPLHKGLNRAALNHWNVPENLRTLVRSTSRHQHRLRLDRHRRRSSPDRLGLSHPALIQR